MRTAILFLATSLVGVALACPGEKTASTEPANNETAHADASATHAYLQVDGVTCHGTASMLHAALLELDGVRSANVSVDGKVDIAYDPEATDVDRLVASVSTLEGYSASKAEAPLTN